MAMITSQILDYVQQQLQAGASRENITASLVSSGWSQQDINDIFTKIGGPTLAGSSPVSTPSSKRNSILTWVVIIVICVATISPSIYRAYRSYQAGQVLKQQIAIAQQQLQQVQQTMNGDTSVFGTTTAPTAAVATVSNGATVTSIGTQTIAQDTMGPYEVPQGTVTLTGTATVGSVAVILKPTSYVAQFITGTPTMYTATSTDYATNSNTWSAHGPLTVVGGNWSVKVPNTSAGNYVVLVYDASQQLIGTGKLTVQLGVKWGAPTATIDKSSLTATSRAPIITGTAANVADLNVQIGEDYYDPHVDNGKWATYSPVTLAPGTYSVTVRNLAVRANEKVLATGTLVVQ